MDEQLPSHLEEIARQVVDAALQVRRELGACLIESAYGEAMCYELASREPKVVRQKRAPLTCRGHQLTDDLRLASIVNDPVIIEVKSVEALLPVHEDQILTYMKLVKVRLGFLIDFNVALIRDGIERKII